MTIIAKVLISIGFIGMLFFGVFALDKPKKSRRNPIYIILTVIFLIMFIIGIFSYKR